MQYSYYIWLKRFSPHKKFNLKVVNMDLYNILKVSKNASIDDVKSAYIELAKKLYLDVIDGKVSAELQFIQDAYFILSDP